jgi:hypothetical protein
MFQSATKKPGLVEDHNELLALEILTHSKVYKPPAAGSSEVVSNGFRMREILVMFVELKSNENRPSPSNTLSFWTRGFNASGEACDVSKCHKKARTCRRPQ